MPDHVIARTENPKVYRPVGACIYCGSTEPPLTREHIIPQGLGGGFILPAASCGKCQRETQQFETDVLRKDMLAFRAHAGIKTRRPKDRPTHFPIRRDPKVPGDHKLVPLNGSPFLLLLPVFGEPTIFTGGDPNEAGGEFQIAVLGSKAQLDEARALNDGIDVTVESQIHVYSFVRMLAKIAHASACSQYGVSAFRPYLLNLILGKSEAVRYYIGQSALCPKLELPETGTQNQNAVAMIEHVHQGKLLLLAAVRLLIPFDTPTYCVVVGEIC